VPLPKVDGGMQGTPLPWAAGAISRVFSVPTEADAGRRLDGQLKILGGGLGRGEAML